ncbi:MAG: hypothetical protein JWN37_236 [Candidatus Nomurabacteria bacterium]|nr:hypothetical protein [Candidatus Nomurabacteria bacterium]
MKAICTICSEQKLKNTESLPIWKKYQSLRILEVRNIANSLLMPFFLISGKFGLINEDEQIGYYDHMLVEHEAPALAKLLKLQIKENNITELHFYAKPRDQSWAPYYDALEQACKESNLPYFIHPV